VRCLVLRRKWDAAFFFFTFDMLASPLVQFHFPNRGPFGGGEGHGEIALNGSLSRKASAFCVLSFENV